MKKFKKSFEAIANKCQFEKKAKQIRSKLKKLTAAFFGLPFIPLVLIIVVIELAAAVLCYYVNYSTIDSNFFDFEYWGVFIAAYSIISLYVAIFLSIIGIGDPYTYIAMIGEMAFIIGGIFTATLSLPLAIILLILGISSFYYGRKVLLENL